MPVITRSKDVRLASSQTFNAQLDSAIREGSPIGLIVAGSRVEPRGSGARAHPASVIQRPVRHAIRPTTLLLLAFTVHDARAQVGTPPCVFSSPPKSAIAWQSGLAGDYAALGRDELAGRVVWVRGGLAVANARILVSPNTRYVLSDSAGRFSMRGLPQGRYLVRIGALGSLEAADSITLGFDGIQIVAALAQYRGDISCTGPAKPP
jgi:hypothetical protein